MYKLLIIDDEEMVRTGLKEHVDWERFGIDVVGEAEDGAEALARIAETPVDIVITDVKMPHMDGIALAKQLRERFGSVKLIFISGFDDLEYVKSALKLEAVDYILKPIQLQELSEVIGKVVSLLQEEEKQRQQRNDMLIKLNQSIPLLRDRFLLTLVSDDAAPADRLAEKFEYLGIRLHTDKGRYSVIKINVDNAAALKEQPEKERQLLSFAILNICEDILHQELIGHAFEIRPGEFAMILNLHSEEEEEKLYGLITECRRQLNQLLKLQITIGVGTTVDRLESVSASYRLASEAAEHKWFLGNNQIITMDSLEQRIGEPKQPAMPDARLFHSLLKSQQADEAAQYFRSWISEFKANPSSSIEACKNGVIQLMIVCSNMLLELGIESEEVRERERRFWERLHQAETIDGLTDFVVSHLQIVHDQIAQRRESKSGNIVADIRAYIEQHYASELTIADIAKSVYLTTTYVCLLFKQETGMTINEYVTEVRMDKAKELLRDHRNKMYEICEAVGYKDQSYFRKLFKKHTGHSPSDYREKWI